MIWAQFCQDNKIGAIYKDCKAQNLRSFRQYAETFVLSPFSMLLTGDAGRGKTYYMLALIRGLLENNWTRSSIRFIRAFDLDEKVEEEVKRSGTANYFVGGLADQKFLFIDDFGVEKSKDRAERNYYQLLDQRLNNLMPTIISTNLKEEEILAVYGTRIDSRLKMCRKLVFTGEDLRTI